MASRQHFTTHPPCTSLRPPRPYLFAMLPVCAAPEEQPSRVAAICVSACSQTLLTTRAVAADLEALRTQFTSELIRATASRDAVTQADAHLQQQLRVHREVTTSLRVAVQGICREVAKWQQALGALHENFNIPSLPSFRNPSGEPSSLLTSLAGLVEALAPSHVATTNAEHSPTLPPLPSIDAFPTVQIPPFDPTNHRELSCATLEHMVSHYERVHRTAFLKAHTLVHNVSTHFSAYAHHLTAMRKQSLGVYAQTMAIVHRVHTTLRPLQTAYDHLRSTFQHYHNLLVPSSAPPSPAPPSRFQAAVHTCEALCHPPTTARDIADDRETTEC